MQWAGRASALQATAHPMGHQVEDMDNHAALRQQLEERLRLLRVRAESISDTLGEEADDDWQEAATDAEGDEVLERVGALAVTEIQQLERALSRIDDGVYGRCAGCAEPIAPKRLAALPQATLCVKCAD